MSAATTTKRLKSQRDRNTLIHNEEPRLLTDKTVTGDYYPISVVVTLLIISRIVSATFMIISDCDETYNYWEPAHFLLHGSGMQTWEYSPAYAIRSYTYLWLHVVFLYFASFFTEDKIIQFYFLRSVLAVICALCETYFYKSIAKHYGSNTAKITFVILLVSSGMFISSSAFLPSSFTMYTTMVAMAAWFLANYKLSIMATAFGAILGWPFAAILGLPIAYDLVIRKRLYQEFFKWTAISLFVFLVPVVMVDSYYYGRIVLAPLNILLYNVFNPHGSDIYGTSPLSYYWLNCFLNYNICFPFAVCGVFIHAFVRKKIVLSDTAIPTWLTLLPMYIWMVIFFTRPHKEERFLFPIYPLVALSAAIFIDSLMRVLSWHITYKRHYHYARKMQRLQISILSVFAVLSISRSIAIYKGYHAPLEIYDALSTFTYKDPSTHTDDALIHVCVGKEWHRFPASFFLPNNNVRLEFVKSDFRGLLPKPYEHRPHASRWIPTDMNDQNKEEPTRYVNVSRCDYLIDLEDSGVSNLQPDYSKQSNHWSVIHSVPFLDAVKSQQIFRAFYIPWMSHAYTHYTRYNLLKARHPTISKHRH